MGALGRAVSFGHDSGGPHLPGGVPPTGRGATVAARSPARTRVRRFNFRLLFVNPFRANRDRTKRDRIRHLRKVDISFRSRADHSTIAERFLHVNPAFSARAHPSWSRPNREPNHANIVSLHTYLRPSPCPSRPALDQTDRMANLGRVAQATPHRQPTRPGKTKNSRFDRNAKRDNIFRISRRHMASRFWTT